MRNYPAGQYATIYDGWFSDALETWTYGSSTTFTVPGDKTGQYTVGTKIKLTQTTVKYFVVSAVSVATGTTTVTVTGGSDYSLANAAIGANYHSYAANPQGWPGWFNWSPTLVGWSGTPTVQARFNVVGKICHLAVFISGTSNANSTTFTLPIAVSSIGMTTWFGGWGRMTDNGTSDTALGVLEIDTSDTTKAHIFRNGTGIPGFTTSGTKTVIAQSFYEIG